MAFRFRRNDAPHSRAGPTPGNKGVSLYWDGMRGGAKGESVNSEVHSSLKASADFPLWRLVRTVSAFTDRSGNHVDQNVEVGTRT